LGYAITQTSKFEGHGSEFVSKHIFIVEKVRGKVYADKLRKEYKKKGVPSG